MNDAALDDDEGTFGAPPMLQLPAHHAQQQQSAPSTAPSVLMQSAQAAKSAHVSAPTGARSVAAPFVGGKLVASASPSTQLQASRGVATPSSKGGGRVVGKGHPAYQNPVAKPSGASFVSQAQGSAPPPSQAVFTSNDGVSASGSVASGYSDSTASSAPASSDTQAATPSAADTSAQQSVTSPAPQGTSSNGGMKLLLAVALVTAAYLAWSKSKQPSG